MSDSNPTLDLLVKNPTDRPGSQPFTLQIDPSATVADLKSRLAESYPGSPPITRQRLIYAGKLLDNTSTLQSLMPTADLSVQHTVHLVVSNPNRTPQPSSTTHTASASSSAAASQPSSTAAGSIASQQQPADPATTANPPGPAQPPPYPYMAPFGQNPMPMNPALFFPAMQQGAPGYPYMNLFAYPPPPSDDAPTNPPASASTDPPPYLPHDPAAYANHLQLMSMNLAAQAQAVAQNQAANAATSAQNAAAAAEVAARQATQYPANIQPAPDPNHHPATPFPNPAQPLENPQPQAVGQNPDAEAADPQMAAHQQQMQAAMMAQNQRTMQMIAQMDAMMRRQMEAPPQQGAQPPPFVPPVNAQGGIAFRFGRARANAAQGGAAADRNQAAVGGAAGGNAPRVRQFVFQFEINWSLIMRLLVFVYLLGQQGSPRRVYMLMAIAVLVYLWQTNWLGFLRRIAGAVVPDPVQLFEMLFPRENRPEGSGEGGATEGQGERNEVVSRSRNRFGRLAVMLSFVYTFVYGFFCSLVPGWRPRALPSLEELLPEGGETNAAGNRNGPSAQAPPPAAADNHEHAD